jgi:hypothetical protein
VIFGATFALDDGEALLVGALDGEALLVGALDFEAVLGSNFLSAVNCF